MKIDLLFTSHNRLEFTQASFTALLENTNWDLVQRLHIADDRSRDGTFQFLCEAVRDIPASVSLRSEPYMGSVNGLLKMLGRTEAPMLGKVDNDTILCPGWLEAMSQALAANPSVDALGMEPGFARRYDPGEIPVYTANRSRWIGGVFLAHRRAFKKLPQQTDRYFGLTAMWRGVHTAWIDPDLPMFLLDLLPFEPWASLTDLYIERGWQRPLHREPGRYGPEFEPYWSWWTAARHHRMETAAQ